MAKITLGGNETNTNGTLPSVGTTLNNYTFVKNDMVRNFNKEAANLDDTAVLCISKDLPFALNRFCGAEGIENVTVASDFKVPQFAEDMGLKIVDGAFEGLDSRVIIVLDKKGNVIYTEQVPEVGQEPDYEAALAAI
ncbi:MAG: thiol peroxidase [Roseivirga sp.]|nr:thiol peroxidase [Roseivirga sp.]